MPQPVPNVTEADVSRIVRRDFRAEEVGIVEAALAEYGRKNWHAEVDRVRLGVLKIANGRLEQLRIWLAVADRDYRDVLASAEYSRYMEQIAPSENNSEKRQRIIAADFDEYRTWFERK